MQNLKKTVLGALSALLLMTSACSSKSDPADEANSNITRINQIHTELSALGVSVGNGAYVNEDASEEKLTQAEALLVEFISRGERVLQIASSGNVIWFEREKLAGQVSSAKNALEKVRALKEQRVLSPAPVKEPVKPAEPVKETPKKVDPQTRIQQIDSQLKQNGADIIANLKISVEEFKIVNGTREEVAAVEESRLPDLFALISSNIKLMSDSTVLLKEALDLLNTHARFSPGYSIAVHDIESKIKKVQQGLIVNVMLLDLVKERMEQSSIQAPVSEDPGFSLLIDKTSAEVSRRLNEQSESWSSVH